jgi:8-amino-7-oxononanoate synthase
VDFTSNDYLGLSRSETLFNNIAEKIRSISPRLLGATGSRLLSGNFEYTEQVEAKLAGIFKSEGCLIFNSGYNANLAVLSSIPQKNDLILYDELAHASIKDGVRLSLATRFPFRHNSIDDLRSKLERSDYGRKFIVVESIYSMNGDQCPLQQYVELADQYNASIILDEAHSTGVLGENGSGLATSLGIENRIAVRIYTFGKAMGTHGACVAGSEALIQFLINTARPFIYTTALPLHTIASIECAFDFLKQNIDLQEKLTGRVRLFLSGFTSETRIQSESAIQCIVVPGNAEVKLASKTLQQNKLDVRPIVSPTVPKGSERLRICLHTFNTDDEIKKLVSLLNQLDLKTTHTA